MYRTGHLPASLVFSVIAWISKRGVTHTISLYLSCPRQSFCPRQCSHQVSSQSVDRVEIEMIALITRIATHRHRPTRKDSFLYFRITHYSCQSADLRALLPLTCALRRCISSWVTAIKQLLLWPRNYNLLSLLPLLFLLVTSVMTSQAKLSPAPPPPHHHPTVQVQDVSQEHTT